MIILNMIINEGDVALTLSIYFVWEAYVQIVTHEHKIFTLWPAVYRYSKMVRFYSLASAFVLHNVGS